VRFWLPRIGGNDGVGVYVGTDVQSIEEISASIDRFGERFTQRIFTDHEVECCGGVTPLAAPGLAARFAAKEAVIKLLKPVDDAPGWRSIEVRRQPGGACAVHLSDTAAERAAALGLDFVDISMSHGAGIGLATVIGVTATSTTRSEQ
jgi:holo-[acyl-carrier protein] synthase